MVKIASALLCDEVRQEDNGKFIAIGIYRGSVQFSKFPTGKGFTVLFQIKDMKPAENYSLGFKVLVGGKKIQEIAGTLTNTSPGIEWLPVQINAVEFTEETNLKIYAKVDEQRWKTILEIPIVIKSANPNPTA